MSLAEARAESAIMQRDIENNIDSLAEDKRVGKHKIETINELAEDWLADCDKRLKYPRIPRQVYRDYIAPTIGEMAVNQVTPLDVRETLRRIVEMGKPTRSNDALGYCKQIFRHGMKLDLVDTNPAEAFRINDAGGAEKSRDRALTVEELKRVFKAIRKHKDQFVRENYLALAILLALGVRKGELIGAKWNEFDFDSAVWHMPKERSKTGVPISVPLAKPVLGWLEELKIRAYGSEFVFPNRRASKRFGHISPDTLNAAIQKFFREDKMSVEYFTVHDFRRTCRSLMEQLSVPPHIAERCLNHKLKGVEGVYDRYDYLEERRDALRDIAEMIAPLVNPSDS